MQAAKRRGEWSLLSQQLVNGIVLGGIYALVALGFTLIFGVSRIGNFAHADIAMLGAYTALILTFEFRINYFLALLLSMLIIGVLGAIIERVAFRPILSRSMTSTFLVGIGLMNILRNSAIVLFGSDTHAISPPISGNLVIGDVSVSYMRIIALVITSVLIFTLYCILRYTSIGRAIRALAQDRDGAQVVGIDANRVNSFIFIVSCALAAAAGTIMGTLFSVEPMMGASPQLKTFTIVVFGGMGSTLGAALGGVILGVTEALVIGYISAAYADVFGFAIMITVLLVKPSGLFGRAER